MPSDAISLSRVRGRCAERGKWLCPDFHLVDQLKTNYLNTEVQVHLFGLGVLFEEAPLCTSEAPHSCPLHSCPRPVGPTARPCTGNNVTQPRRLLCLSLCRLTSDPATALQRSDCKQAQQGPARVRLKGSTRPRSITWARPTRGGVVTLVPGSNDLIPAAGAARLRERQAWGWSPEAGPPRARGECRASRGGWSWGWG